MGHLQPHIPLRTNNKTAQGILSGKFKQKRSKSIDMRFHWFKDRIVQGQFRIDCAQGKENFGDTPTKHHPFSHQKETRPMNLYLEGKSPSTLKRCI